MKSKRSPKYTYVKRYNRDFWGELYRDGFKKSWSENKQNFRVFLKNIKVVDKRIKERLIFRVKRSARKFLRAFRYRRTFKRIFKRIRHRFFRRFFYRVDIIKLNPKRVKRTLHRLRLRIRHVFVRFASGMKFGKFQSYILKSRRSSRLMCKFFEMFEGRLDFFLYRMNLIKSSPLGRQLITHKFFKLNDRCVNISGLKVTFLDYVTPLNVEGFFWWYYERLCRMLRSKIVYRKGFVFFTRSLKKQILKIKSFNVRVKKKKKKKFEKKIKT